jgi:HK97 family phage major capsid protein
VTNLPEMIRSLGETFNEKAGDLSSRLSELEKRAAREPADYTSNRASGPSLGELIANHDALKERGNHVKAHMRFDGAELAAITSGTGTVGTTTSPGTSLVPAHRIPGVHGPYQRQLRVHDLFAQSTTTSNMIEYPVETSYSLNAAPVAETTAKPESSLTFDLKTAPVRTIAHIFRVSRQIFDDAEVLASYLNTRGVYGLETVVENQLLYGNGTGQNLLGIIPQATEFSAPFTSMAETPIDRINQAIAQVEAESAPVSGIVLHPTDWREILGTKDAGGNYISQMSPFGIQTPTLWGVPVVSSLAVAQGEFAVGAFNIDAEIFNRMGIEVLVSSEDGDNFSTNMLTVRIETRLAMAVYKPTSFVTGELVPPTP